jgi:hypothetical protein
MFSTCVYEKDKEGRKENEDLKEEKQKSEERNF